MKLTVQKRLAADILKCSKKRIVLDSERLEDIKEAITKADIKGLIIDKAVVKTQKKGVSRARAKKRQIQKSAGKRKGHGKRKGKATARLPKKKAWAAKIRTQRKFIRELREKKIITQGVSRTLYMKSKGGYFRSRRHIKIYINEHSLTIQEK